MGFLSRFFGRSTDLGGDPSPVEGYLLRHPPSYTLDGPEFFNCNVEAEVRKQDSTAWNQLHVTLSHPAHPYMRESWHLRMPGERSPGFMVERKPDGTIEDVLVWTKRDSVPHVVKDHGIRADVAALMRTYDAVLDMPHYRKLTRDLPLPDVLPVLDRYLPTDGRGGAAKVAERTVDSVGGTEEDPLIMVTAKIPRSPLSELEVMARRSPLDGKTFDEIDIWGPDYISLAKSHRRESVHVGPAVFFREPDGRFTSSYPQDVARQVFEKADALRRHYTRLLDLDGTWEARPKPKPPNEGEEFRRVISQF